MSRSMVSTFANANESQREEYLDNREAQKGQQKEDRTSRVERDLVPMRETYQVSLHWYTVPVSRPSPKNRFINPGSV